MSAPASPGGVIRVSASRSAAATSSAPRSCAASASGARSRIAPDAPGYCTSTPNTSPSGSGSARSCTTTSRPSGRARVRTTSRVWGSTSASTTNVLPAFAGAVGERHRLGRGGRLVEHRRAGDRQPGEVLDDGLEVEQRLEPALADLGLVGRVGGVPGRVLQHVAADHRRRDRAVVAQPDHRGQHLVAGGQRAQLGGDLGLGGRRRQRQGELLADRGRHGVGEQVVQASRSRARRASAAGPAGADVALGEGAGVLEIGEACGAGSSALRAGVDAAPRGARPRLSGAPLQSGLLSGNSVRSWCLRGSGEVAPSAPARGRR